MKKKEILSRLDEVITRIDNIATAPAVEVPITLDRLADFTGIPITTLRGYHQKGKIPTFKLEGKVLIYVSEFNSVCRSL